MALWCSDDDVALLRQGLSEAGVVPRVLHLCENGGKDAQLPAVKLVA